ncbi:MAG: class I SAM-dependent methyltransferase [Gemmatimonadaceae bacterium]
MPNELPETTDLVREMQQYYDRRAPVYDHSMGYDDPAIVEAIAPVVEVLCEEMRERTVLEIACGPGFWTERVARVARRILATDYNESTLLLADKKEMPGRVDFMRVDAYDLSPINDSFDAAFAVDWLAHVPQSRLSRFLVGLHDHLSLGARITFCDQTPRDTSWTGLYDVEGNHLQERQLSDGSRHRVIKHFFSDDELTRLFEPYARDLMIRRLAGARRVLVSYTLAPR